MTDKPFSPACERNREPILAVLAEVFARAHAVLEIGSGTGQHAVYFARELPHLQWYPSDRAEYHAGIDAWRADEGTENLHPPVLLDVNMPQWPAVDGVDAVFSANTAHIMSWHEVCRMLRGVAAMLPDGAPFCLYGPFNRDGEFTSDSNREFHQSLQLRMPHMGLRDIDALREEAGPQGLMLEAVHELPANNLMLVWRCTRGA